MYTSDFIYLIFIYFIISLTGIIICEILPLISLNFPYLLRFHFDSFNSFKAQFFDIYRRSLFTDSDGN